MEGGGGIPGAPGVVVAASAVVVVAAAAAAAAGLADRVSILWASIGDGFGVREGRGERGEAVFRLSSVSLCTAKEETPL